jgi:hypothetical protein
LRLTTAEPRRSSSWGWLLWELGFWTRQEKETFENLAHEAKITKGWLRLPVCWWHRWVAPPLVAVGMVNDRKVVLYGAGDAFVAALKKRGLLR